MSCHPKSVQENLIPLRSGKQARILIAGNPNSGKTTLFNALTKSNYKVANYPGVTVEKKEGRLDLGDMQATLVDLPGIYSLFGTSPDELIATSLLSGLMDEEPSADLLIAVADATNLERNLYLLSQLLDGELPIVLALTMTDVADEQGIKIYQELISRQLEIPVVPVVAKSGRGIEELKKEIQNLLVNKPQPRKSLAWVQDCPDLLDSVNRLLEMLEGNGNGSKKVDKHLMALALLCEIVKPSDDTVRRALENEQAALSSKGINPHSIEALKRYDWIKAVIKSSTNSVSSIKNDFSERVDKVLTHRVFGTFIFLLIMGLIFQTIFSVARYPMDWIAQGLVVLENYVRATVPAGALQSLLADGVLAGVGSVLIFIPQIVTLFFFIALLEDTGYLARAAYLMDRVMSLVGLQGRSFIPLLNCFACAVPGIMSTRIIPSRTVRLSTILIAPLMSCSARLPVYTLLISAFIPQRIFFGFVSFQGLVLLSLYLFGILLAAGVALVLKKLLEKKESTYFVMELPKYRKPSMKIALREVRDRLWSFFANAGKVIFICSLLLWFLASYPKRDGVSDINFSYAAKIGKAVEPAIRPLGFNWEMGVALVGSFAAREVFVSTLATVYNIQDTKDTAASLLQIIEKKSASGEFSLATALSLLAFFVIACQCSSTLAVCKRETGSWKWAAVMFSYTLVLAYLLAFVVRVGTDAIISWKPFTG